NVGKRCAALQATEAGTPPSGSARHNRGSRTQSFRRPLAQTESSFGGTQNRHREIRRENESRLSPLCRGDRTGEQSYGQRVSLLAIEHVVLARRPVVIDDPNGHRIADLPRDRLRERVIPYRPMRVANDRRRPINRTGDFHDDAQVGCSSGKILADLLLDLAPAQGDTVLAGDGDFVPPFLVSQGVSSVSTVGVVAQVVTHPLCNLSNIFRVGLSMVVSLTVGINIPFPQDSILRLHRLTHEPPARLMRLQIVLELLDPAREPRGVLAREIASLIDVLLV